MTDFNAIFRPETEGEKQSAAQQKENRDSSKALYSSLNNGDYLSAGKILQQAGSCQWDQVVKSDDITNLGIKHYEAHYSITKDKTSVEIIERLPSTTPSRPDVYVPRLTVTDDSCNEQLKK